MARFPHSRYELPTNTPEMKAWDDKLSQSPLEQYLEKIRGGLDPVCGEQWGYQVTQQLPEAALNEVGGLLSSKVVRKLASYGNGGCNCPQKILGRF